MMSRHAVLGSLGLITLLGASAAAAALPVRGIGAAEAIDARVFAPAVESGVPLDLTVPHQFAPLLRQIAASADAAHEAIAAVFDVTGRLRARLMLADEVDPYPPTPPVSIAAGAP